MPLILILFTFYAHCGDLDRYAVSNRTGRDVFVHKAESADVRFITQVQTADILNHPVVLGRLPLLDLRILPIFKSCIDITFIAIYGGVWQAPLPMCRNLLILLRMLLRLQQRRHR